MNADFFVNFGLFVQRDALPRDLVARLVSDIRSSATHAATVRENGVQAVDPDYRRTQIARLSAASTAAVKDAMLALRPTLEAHFGVVTTGCREPEFLVYREGDFFARHADSVPVGQAADAVVSARRISVVVFLNGESAAPDGYGGGSLDFYGLMDEERMNARPMSLSGEAGLLVAFRPETAHGVSPVTRGERYTVVTWFEG